MKREIPGFMRRSRPPLSLWLVLLFFLSLGTFIAAASLFRSLGRANARLVNLADSVCDIARTAYDSGRRNQLSRTAGTLARLGGRPYPFEPALINLAGRAKRPTLPSGRASP